MVVAQVALSLVLLTAGGLVVRSFEQLLRANPGFDPRGVLTLRVPAVVDRYPNDTAVAALHARVERELAALPGVTAVGGSTALPLSADANQTTIDFPGAPGNTGVEDHDEPLVDVMAARAGYFDALGIRRVAGPGFSTGTGAGVREAVIDRTLAEYFFPTGSPVGFRLPFGDDTLTIVGVVEHARQYDVHADGRPQLYFHDDYDPDRGLSFALRTERDPSSLVPEVRAAIRRIDPQLAVAELRPMDDVVRQALRQPRVSAVLIAGFSIGALLLAAMGLFGVVAGSVNRRRHEIAVRLALGAGHGSVLRLVLQEGAVLVALGLALGVPGIYFAGRVLRGVLVGVSPFDPVTLGAVAAGLAVVALLACYVPARRVATIEPAQAFRDA
jgi:predicted permease